MMLVFFRGPRARRVLAVVCWLLASTACAGTDPPLKLGPRPTSDAAGGPASFSSDLPQLEAESLRTVGSALAVVLGLFTLWTAFQRSQSRRDRSGALMRSLGCIQLTPKVKLHVVRLGQRLLVLHVAGGRVERIAEISDPAEVASLLGSREASLPVSPRVEELLQASERLAAPASSRGLS